MPIVRTTLGGRVLERHTLGCRPKGHDACRRERRLEQLRELLGLEVLHPAVSVVHNCAGQGTVEVSAARGCWGRAEGAQTAADIEWPSGA